MEEKESDNITVRVGPDGVEVTAPLLRCFRRKKPDPVLGVPERFLRLFDDHGVPITQIPRLMPEIGLGALRSNERLLAALTPKRIAEAADLFGVRREWIEGATWRMYDLHLCYKRPDRFFEQIKTMRKDPDIFPVSALCTDERFNERRSSQPITFILTEKIYELGERDIVRYKVFSDQMDWNYWKCRNQIRAMVRVLYRLNQEPVPIYVVSKRDLDDVDNGRVIPGVAVSRGRRLHDLSLEDFSMFPDESADSKSDDHLQCAIDQWEKQGLDRTVEEMFGRPLETIKKCADDRVSGQVALVAESSRDYEQIFLRPNDDFRINGKAVNAIKTPRI